MGWVIVVTLVGMLGPGPHLAEFVFIMALWSVICLILGWLLWGEE